MPLPDVGERGGSGSPAESDLTGQRFARSLRITSRRQFLEIYRRGRSVRSPSMTLFGQPNGLGRCRLGITVTRKVGTAVRRNRIKRVFREIYRRNRSVLPMGLDIVINAHPGIHEVAYRDLEREFLKNARRLARRFQA